MQAIIPYPSSSFFFSNILILLFSLNPNFTHALAFASPTGSSSPTATLQQLPPTITTLTVPIAPSTLFTTTPTTSDTPLPPEATAPHITATPVPASSPGTEDPAAAAAVNAERFRQTTYWSCVQQPGVVTAHCGWHEPVLDASLPNAAGGVRMGPGIVGLSSVGLVVMLVVSLGL